MAEFGGAIVRRSCVAEAVKEYERRPLFVARPAKPAAVTPGPVILFTAGGRRFAVAASEVEEIRDA